MVILVGLLFGLITVKFRKRKITTEATKTIEAEKLNNSIKELQDSQNLIAATLAIALLKR